jgi:hypothetical protein
MNDETQTPVAPGNPPLVSSPSTPTPAVRAPQESPFSALARNLRRLSAQPHKESQIGMPGLVAQAALLNGVFTELLIGHTGDMAFDKTFNIALRAQKQYVDTVRFLETLANSRSSWAKR